MRKLKLAVDSDFSETAVEAAQIVILNEAAYNTIFGFKLWVSVFDIPTAVKLMIQNDGNRCIIQFTVTPNFRSGEWEIQDYKGDYSIHTEA